VAGETERQPDTCEICGRSILQGESTQAYISPDGESHAVCELCRVRVEQSGWVRADRVSGETLAQHGRERRRRARLGGLLGRRRNRREDGPEGEPEETSPPGEEEEVAAVEEGAGAGEPGDEAPPADTGAAEQEAGEDAQVVAESEPDAAARARGKQKRTRDSKPARGRKSGIRERLSGGGRDPRHVRAVPADPESKVQRAMELFNDSEHSRTVAGVVRSLGLPSVSAGASAKTPSEVRLTVAWELSWYQWAVDLAEEGEPVRAIGQGAEIAELDGPAREWNAHADEEGLLHPGLPK
jgi:hypothetical protein